MKKEKEDDGVDEMKGQNIRLFFSCFYLQKLKTVWNSLSFFSISSLPKAV